MFHSERKNCDNQESLPEPVVVPRGREDRQIEDRGIEDSQRLGRQISIGSPVNGGAGDLHTV